MYEYEKWMCVSLCAEHSEKIECEKIMGLQEKSKRLCSLKYCGNEAVVEAYVRVK